MNTEKKFIFDGFKIDNEKSFIVFKYSIFNFEESLNFEEKLIFPKDGFNLDTVPSETLEEVLNNLSLAIGISYWKTYCPSDIDLGDIFLTQKQAEFWNKVYADGLGEFYYTNKINPEGIIKFPYEKNLEKNSINNFKRKNRSLLLFGGGKDSIVSVELLKKNGKNFALSYINEDRIKKETASLLEKNPLIIKREVDEKLIEFGGNKNVYKGHVPVSMIWAFIYSFVAVVYDFKYIITSNERSANFGNVEYLGREINHQWSKSWEAEKMINNYIKDFITTEITYFSILRSFSELKIAKLFSEYKKYFLKFSSCNANFKIKEKLEDSLWCKKCPKCVFVFTMLSAFLPEKELVDVFGENLYQKKELIPIFEELLGTKGHKPLECVGTPKEMNIAMSLASRKDDYKNDKIINYFKESVLNVFSEQDLEKLFSNSKEHSVPDEFKELINQ